MAELLSPAGALPFIPDDLTLAQFILDSQHPSRPVRKHGTPWIIEDHTGKTVGYEEIRTRVFGLANGLHTKFNIKEDDVAPYFGCFFDARSDYLVAVWAAHRLGAIMSGANPSFTSDELTYQAQATSASVVITHPGLIVRGTFRCPGSQVASRTAPSYGKQITIQALIDEGLASGAAWQERKLRPGEGKTKLAFLNFSSGTDWQTQAHHRLNDPQWENQRFRPGDVCCADPLQLLLSGVVPPQVVLLLQSKGSAFHPAVKEYDLSHVRYLTSGAAPLSLELMERLAEIFPKASIGQSYGQLLPGITARVERPDGTLADFDEPGELVVTTPSLALGYAQNPEAWLRTGDEVRMNRRGEIFVLDRLKTPASWEFKDEYSGELPLAFVVLQPDAANRVRSDSTEAGRIKQSIMKHVADNKVAYKKLAGGVEFINVIPKNPSGKLLRRVLRDMAREMTTRSRAVATAKL
ncbi:phenylacetyl-CoA ligase [Melanogaster broomeanus]|nr:phenylacetyl-CoA ligase [Melanogaster broomeanus]